MTNRQVNPRYYMPDDTLDVHTPRLYASPAAATIRACLSLLTEMYGGRWSSMPNFRLGGVLLVHWYSRAIVFLESKRIKPMPEGWNMETL
ncbi:MAG: hypothetical protein V1929_08230 [bacterium]